MTGHDDVCPPSAEKVLAPDRQDRLVHPLDGLLGGLLGETLGLRATLLVAVVGGALAPGWLLASPLRGLRDLPVK
jgi:hypothetical protein